MPYAQCIETLIKPIDRPPRRATDAGPALVQNCSNGVDRQKRSGSVGVDRPTDPATSREFVNLLMKVAFDSQSLCVSALGDKGYLITLNLEVTKDLSLYARVDCGPSNNFVYCQSLEVRRLMFVESDIPPTRITVRLATGASITLMKRLVGLHYTLEDLQYDDDFIVLDLDDKFDVILGLLWIRSHEPRVIWQHRTVKISATCSSDRHLMNVLELPQACGCTSIEYDGLTCGTVVTTTAQGHSETTNHTVEDCRDAIAVRN